MSNETMTGNSGAVAAMTLNSDADLEPGAYTVMVNNIEITNSNFIASNPDAMTTKLNIKAPYVPVKGDVNVDEVISITDAVLTIDYILGNNPENFRADLADMDDNGSVTITDVVILVEKVLGRSNTRRAARTRGFSNEPMKITVSDLNLSAGESVLVNVFVENLLSGITALQCDVELPYGLEFAFNENGTCATLGEGAGGFYIAENINGNTMRVALINLSGHEFSGNNIFNINVRASENYDGEGNLAIYGIEASNGESVVVESTLSNVVISSTTGIGESFILNGDKVVEGCYTVSGNVTDLRTKGIIIVKYTDGTTKKITNR